VFEGAIRPQTMLTDSAPLRDQKQWQRVAWMLGISRRLHGSMMAGSMRTPKPIDLQCIDGAANCLSL
jgi:hypothetical protein